MPGPLPKDPSTRARRNTTSTKATLRADASVVAPDLPDFPMGEYNDSGEFKGFPGWHEMTLAWWTDLWASPMAPEYDHSDRHGLFMVAMLVNDYWWTSDSKERRELMVRIEAAWKNFGTAPLPRRSLQWEIEKVEQAQDEGAKRRAAKTPPAKKSAKKKVDPRSILSVVS